ncbi:MAG: hypothetical protein M3Y93_13980 [Pseudomonadota bacterium]|nr:hypothetical protein [Pseudomonadota bacterium]
MQQSPRTGKSPDPPLPPAPSEPPVYPVQAILSKPSRLVFRVGTEEIAYTEKGLITAMGRLPLSVVSHAESYSSLLSWDIVAAHAGVIDRVSRAVAAATKTANRSRTALGRTGTLHQQITSDHHAADVLTALSTYARTQRTASQIDARFGAYSAVAAVAQGTEIAKVLAPAYRPRREPPQLREPSGTETAIELPWRLQLSPHSKGAFAHSAVEIAHGGRVELWHTRLGTRVDAPPTDALEQQHSSVSENDPATRTVRAVWTREFDLPDWAPTTRPLVFPQEDLGNTATLSPFRASLSQRDRMMIVHETSNYHAPGMPPAWTPTPVSVNHLMLTALGGWLDSEVRFATTSTDLTVEEWKHRATMGRDQYVKVVYSGLLHPFGHRASLVKVTERRVVSGELGGPHATLYQRLFVVVRQPERTFGIVGTASQKNRMPFSWVRILTASTPPLAPPRSLFTQPDPGVGQMFMPEIAGVAGAGTGAEPFRFQVLARDIDNHLVEFEGPMVFIEDSRFGKPNSAAALDAANQTQISYPMRGQRVAYAPPGDADDTTLATVSMRLDAELDAAGGGTDRNYILPVLKTATATIPALSAFTGQSDPVLLAYPPAYTDNGFGGKGKNDGEVFLALVKSDGTAAVPVTMGLNAKSDRSGGFVSPSVDIKALARRVGPVGGDLVTLASDATSFDVGSMFGLDTAKLFGILPLADLLPKTGGILPKFVTEAVSVVTALQQAIVQVKSILVAQTPAFASQAAEVRAAAGALVQRATEFADATAGLAASPPVVADFGPILSGIHDTAGLLLGTLTAAERSLTLPRPIAEQLEALLRLLVEATGAASDIVELVGLITTFYAGGLVPEVVNARLDWETQLTNWPDDTKKIFAPGGDAKLRLVSEIRAALKGGTPQALISCSLPPFQLRLMGDTHFISINVAVMEFAVKPGHKPDVNVRLEGAGKGIEFAGPLAFVETLKQIIPFDGFSDPPYLDISTSGLRAGFDLAIPDLAMGIFALTNIHLGAELIVPFIGESLEFRFFFATRENPFRLQVAFFAGGGFFAITISPNGLRVIEASFEFGAAVAMSFVVASGSLSVMAGIYFRLEIDGPAQKVQLTGYFRARGEVDVLGLISACIELYLELSYFEDGGKAKAIGKASISIEVSVCFLSFSVSVSCEKKFAGSAGDPTFLDMMGPYTDNRGRAHDPWLAYCRAFAAEAA